MKLKTAEIKRFFNLSSSIKTNGILPILDLIKIDNDRIYKTNTNAWIVCDITATNEQILLDEKILSEYVKRVAEDYIDVKIETSSPTKKNDPIIKTITLKSGKVPKVTFSLPDDYVNFPVFPINENPTPIRIEEDVLKAIGVAAKNVIGGNNTHPFDFIHLTNGYVLGSDTNRFYFKKFDYLPNTIIDPQCANTIYQFGGAEFTESDKFNFFQIGTITYAFVKNNFTTPDTSKLFSVFKKDSYLEITVSELLEFLDLVTSVSPMELRICSIKGNKLYFKDADYERDVEFELTTTGDFQPDFSFSAKVFAPYFKSLGKEKVRLSPLHQPWGVSVWDNEDADFVGFISGVTNE